MGVVNEKLKIQALFNFCADDLVKLLGLFFNHLVSKYAFSSFGSSCITSHKKCWLRVKNV